MMCLFTATVQGLAQNSGVNTKNPKGPLHVDAGKNNNASGTLSNGQDADDFMVDPDGKVGIGTSTPTHKLDVRGKIQIKDGGEKVGAVLTTDATGLAAWNLPSTIKPLVRGAFPTSVTVISSTGTATPLNTGTTITLSRGKWIVNAGVTFRNISTTIFQRCYLSTATNSLQQNGFTFLGPAGAQTSYGGILKQGLDRGFVTGSALIEVTQPSVTLYLLLQNQSSSYQYPSDAWENYFYAKPID